MPELNDLLASISRMGIEYRGPDPAGFFRQSLFLAAENVEVRDINGKIVQNNEFIKTLRDLVRLGVTGRDDEEIVGEESIVEVIADMLGQDIALGKTAIYYKVLEEVSIRSEEDDIWRPAMMAIGKEVTEETAGAPDANWRPILAAECLRSILMQCHGEKRDFARNILLCKKTEMAVDILCEGMFRRYPGNERAIGLTLAYISGHDTILAALFSRSAAPPIESKAFTDRFHEKGMSLSPAEGKGMTQALLRGRAARTSESMMRSALIRGFQDIFDISRIELPHPWFLESVNGFGLPVPRLDQRSLHMAAFLALPNIGSGEALGVMAQGIGQLIVPNMTWGNDGRLGYGEIRAGIPDISDALIRLSRSNGILSANSELLSSLVLGHPKMIDIMEPPRGSLLSISPVLIRIAMEADWAGACEAPLCVCASDGVLRGLMTSTDESGRNGACLVKRNIEAIARAHKETFFRFTEEDRKKMHTFLRTLSRKGFRGDGHMPMRNRNGC